MPNYKKGYISRQQRSVWNNESYEAEKARYEFAKEEFERLKKEVEQKIAERKAILEERELNEPVRTENNTVLENRELNEQPKVDTDANTTNNVNDGTDNKKTESFFTSLWMSLFAGLRHSTSPSAPGLPIPSSTKITKLRDEAIKVFWTKDAVAAYNISKNKGEADKYAGDIILNKEKQLYADVINTYADNLQDYINYYREFDAIKNDNSAEGLAKKSQLLSKMSLMLEWLDDLDDQMKIAMSYNMAYGSNLGSITSYEASIGNAGGSATADRLQEKAKRLYNQFQKIRNSKDISLKDIKLVNDIINSTKVGYLKYSDKINKDNLIAKLKMDEEYEDLKEWEEWHTPSAEYKLKEKAAQSNYLFDWDTYAYSFPGVLGSSMTFGGILLLSSALNIGGGVAIQTGNPYAVAGGVASTLAGAGLGIASGINENAIEVGSNYKDALREDLEKNNLLEDFILKGERLMKKRNLFYHKDENDKLEDILNYFVRGDIEYNDQRINEIATKHLFGANNLFQNDMMAVTADVVFDTGLNLFTPAGSVAKALKITPVGKFNSFTRAVANVSSKHPLIGNIIRRTNAVESGVGTELLDAMSPVAGNLYRAAKVALPQLNKIHKGAEHFANAMAKGVKNLAGFITSAPASAFKLRTVGKGALDFAGIELKRGFSEAIEEGKLYEYGERFKKGGFAGESNSILETLLDDFSTGTSSALAFFGSQFLGIDSDSELMANMRGGFIGGLLNHGTLLSAYQLGNKTISELKAGDALVQNVLLQRINERGNMLNYQKFVKYATDPAKIASMNEAFDRAIRISEDYKNDADNGANQSYWTREELEQLREQFNKIVALSNSATIRLSLDNQHIDIDSERGGAAVALIAYALDKNKEDTDIINDHISQFNLLLSDNRLSSDQIGNILQIVEDIQNIELNENLSAEEIKYLKSLYEESEDADNNSKPKFKGNSRQRRKLNVDWKNKAAERISEKIKRRVEHDKAMDAAFAKKYALLKLANELNAIPEDMRTNTQKNQLISINHLIEEFDKSLTPIQKLIFGVQDEQSLYELGKSRGFFNLIANAYRTIALDKASLLLNSALLNSLLGRDANMFTELDSAANLILQLVQLSKDLHKQLSKNIIKNAKSKDTLEQERGKLIDQYLNSVKDDYALFEQIRDNFREAREYLNMQDAVDMDQEMSHKITTGERLEPQTSSVNFDDAARMIQQQEDELRKRQLRKEKRKRWRENKRRRMAAWENMNDAWEEPENDELIRNLYDPVDIDELPSQNTEDDYTLEDYMAQYDDAWEEPWWDEMMAERDAAEAEDAAFLEQYSNNNRVIKEYDFNIAKLKEKYKEGTFIFGKDSSEKSRLYKVIGHSYNKSSRKLVFAIQYLKTDGTPDKRYKVHYVDQDTIVKFSILKQTDIDFSSDPQPKTLKGIKEGSVYNIAVELLGLIHTYSNITVVKIDDSDPKNTTIYGTNSNGSFQFTVAKFEQGIKLWKAILIYARYLNGSLSLDESDVLLVLLAYNNVFTYLANSGIANINHSEVLKTVEELYVIQKFSVAPLESSNSVDTFYRDENGKMMRKTNSSYLVGDMYEDAPHEIKRIQHIVRMFSETTNTEHVIHLLEAWYNNTIDPNLEGSKEILDALGNPTKVSGENLHNQKIDLSPYIELYRLGDFGPTEILHLAYIISREYSDPEVSTTDVYNDIIERVILTYGAIDLAPLSQQKRNKKEVLYTDSYKNKKYSEVVSENAFNKLVQGIKDFIDTMRNSNFVPLYLPINTVSKDYAFYNNLFLLDSTGRLRAVHFPIRWYDYEELLNSTDRKVKLYDSLNSTLPVGYRLARISEMEWLSTFSKIFNDAILNRLSVHNYIGIIQQPIRTVIERKRNTGKVEEIYFGENPIKFDEHNNYVDPVKDDVLAEVLSTKILDLHTALLKIFNQNKDILPKVKCFTILDNIESYIDSLRPGIATQEDIKSVINTIESAINYIGGLVDAYHLQSSLQLGGKNPKKSGGPNQNAEKMLPDIRKSFVVVQQLVNEIDKHVKAGGFIRKSTKDALLAFLQNDARFRYYEKLKGSSLDSDKLLADLLNELRATISRILSTYPYTFGNDPQPDANTPVFEKHTLQFNMQNRVSFAEVLSNPDFANTAQVELIYGVLDQKTGNVQKLNAFSTISGAGVYAIITYGQKIYPPVNVLPAHYMDTFNTLTKDGTAFVNEVIQQQLYGKVYASGLYRLIPNVNYNGNLVPITKNKALGITELDILKMTPDSTTIGMCRTSGRITKLNSTQSSVPIGVLNTNTAANNIGGVFYIKSFDFQEYQEGSANVPIRLLNARLKDGDISVIINILKDIIDKYESGAGNVGMLLNRPYEINNKLTPFTVLLVLMFFSNFSQNLAKCRIFINPDGKISIRSTIKELFSGLKFDPRTSVGEQAIRDFFEKISPYVFNHVTTLNGRLSNKSDDVYGKLSSYIEENGGLIISPSLSFDEDDVFMNNEGFYGIGWALRHGRLLCNVSSIYEPSIAMEGVSTSTQNPPILPNPQPQPSAQTKTSSLLDLIDTGEDWLNSFAGSTVEYSDKKLDKELALSNLKRMFGDNLDVEIRDALLGVMSSGNIVGQAFIDSIILSTSAAYGTEYHEAFHRAIELLVDSNTRKKVYNIYKKRHPELNGNIRELAEYMAEDFRIWMTEIKPESIKLSFNVIKIFKQIGKWINALRKIGSFRLAYIYYKLNTGAYKNIAPSQDNIVRFISIFGNYAPMTIYNAQSNTNVKINSVTSVRDYKDAVSTISHMITANYLREDGIVEVQDLDFSIDAMHNLKGYSLLVGNPDKLTAANKVFRELFDNWDSVKYDVITSLKQLGLGIRQNKSTGKISVSKSSLDSPLDVDNETERDEQYTKEGAIAEMMDYVSKESYEISRARKIKDLVKFLLSEIRDMHYVEEGEVDEDGNKIPQWVFETNSQGQYIDENNNPIVNNNGVWECTQKDGTVLTGNQIVFKKHRNRVTNKNAFGFAKYFSFQEVYAKLLSDCHYVNTLPEFILLLLQKAKDSLMYELIYNKILPMYNNLLYVDKEGYNHDTFGGLWRRVFAKESGTFVYLKVNDDKRPVQISEEIALKSGTTFLFNGKYFLAKRADELNLQYNYNNVATITLLFNAVSGSKLNYKMVISTRDTLSNIQYRISDTDAGHTARRYTQSWYISFLANTKKVDVIEHNGVVLHRTKDAKLFDNVANFFTTLVDAYIKRTGNTSRTGNFVYNGTTYNIYTNTDIIKRLIVLNFNSIGVNIDKKTFEHLLFEMFGDIGYNGIVRYLSLNGDSSGKIKGVSIEMFIKSLQNCQKSGVFEASLESGAFFTKNGVISQLANAKYSYNISHKLLMVSAPGNNKYYAMSEKNTITFMTESLSDKDGQTVRDFSTCPYYTYTDPLTGISQSTFILLNILSGKYKLVFDNFVGYRNEDLRGDTGSDFMLITNAEDLISKITLLENDYMVFPSMSNKKTYGEISLQDKDGNRAHIPGIRFVSNPNDSRNVPYRAEGLPLLIVNTVGGEICTNGTYSKYTFVLTDEVYNTLINYAMMEYQTVKYGIGLVPQLGEHEKVDNLHKPNKKVNQKSAGICRFPRFYGVFEPNVTKDSKGNVISIDRKFINFNDNNKSDIDNLKEAERVFFGQGVSHAERKAYISELVMNQLDKWLEKLEQSGIIRKRLGWRSIANPYLRYESNILDFNLINSIAISSDNTINGTKLSTHEAKSLAIVQLALDVMIKHQISMEEILRLYAGHPGQFATRYNEDGRIVDDEQDLSKRLGGLVSTGETNALGLLGIPTEYVCSEIDDYKVSSPQAEDFHKAFNESEHRSVLFNTAIANIDAALLKIGISELQFYETSDSVLKELKVFINNDELLQKLIDEWYGIVINKDTDYLQKKNAIQKLKSTYKDSLCKNVHLELKELTLEAVSEQLQQLGLKSGVDARVGAYTSSYEKGINVADGMSFISPKMAKNMLLQLGLYKGPVVQAFKYLEKGIDSDVLGNAKACSIIMKAMLGTLKYTAYGYRMYHGFPEFYYNKTALFPMFKLLCTTPKLKAIYDMMTKGDEPIDMLMFKSAVKVGGRGSQPLPNKKDDLDNFKPNTYKQSFKFLIKQLNTDPKEREKMAMGSQALKVVESILNRYITDYQRRNEDGTLSESDTVSGDLLLDEIMHHRKEIIRITLDTLMKKFYDESGSKNEKEFTSWLKSNLTDRDASWDLLEGLTIDDETGVRNARLSSLSDSGWVQSVVTSLINKQLIDLNLPGNMFIQRSVFGMEGPVIVSDKYVPKLNNGNRLQLVNEQGSMDAVISVDFFIELFPELKGKSFKELRQWLIDKGLIGQKAKSQCISYRIPTQAASSISALRFVDVIPVVRDTIILPEEFTALTGSDFDIDKLFFSFKNLRIDENGNVTDKYEKDTIEYHLNQLLEDFITLLQQDRNRFANISLRSIDNDTEIGKSVAEELLSGGLEVDPYDALSLWRQSQIKEDNRTGSIGIGPSALNNSSHNQTRLYDVHFESSNVVRQLGISSLAEDLDVDSVSVLGLIGAFINGHVDNAKDPWVSIVGLNPYTYNLANLLARTGFGRKTLYLTAQPVIKELSKIHAYAQGSLFRDGQQSSHDLEDSMIRDFENENFLNVQGGISSEIREIFRVINSFEAIYGGSEHSDDEEAAKRQHIINRTYSIIKLIIGMDQNNPRKLILSFKDINGNVHENSTILRDVAIRYAKKDSAEAMRDHIKLYMVEFDGKQIKLSTNEVLMYMYILNKLLLPYANYLSNLVQYTKIDTKKQGKNIFEQFAYLNGYERLYNSNAFDANLREMLDSSYIDMLTRLSIEFQRLLLSDEYIEACDPMLSNDKRSWVNLFISFSGARINADSVKAIGNGITSYIKYKYIRDYADLLHIDIKSLFVGENSIYNQLVNIKTSILENPHLYKEYIDFEGDLNNALLNQLEPSYIREKDFLDIRTAPKFIEFLTLEDNESSNINDIRNAWSYMLTDNKHKDIQEFAKRLIVYSFVTSGDINGAGGNMFKYVPYLWRNELSAKDGMSRSYCEYISDYIKDVNDLYQASKEDDRPIPILETMNNRTIMTDILMNNWYNSDLVPTLQKKKGNSILYLTISLDANTNSPDILIAAEMRIERTEKGYAQHVIKQSSLKSSPAVIKVHKDGHTTYNQLDFYFYKLYSYGRALDRYGNAFTYPIYVLINPRGGVFYGHKILEYMTNYGFSWNTTNEYIDESKLFDIEKRIAQWNEVLPLEFGNLSKSQIERVQAQTYLYSDMIGADDRSLITLLTLSMALYDSYVNRDRSFDIENYKEKIEKKTSKISYSDHDVTREEVISNPNTLYIFTDNTNRTSGNNPIDRNSRYYKKYGDGKNDLFYPTTTTAILRGLNNAMPISTQRFYDVSKGLTGKNGRWTNENIDEFRQTVDAEFDDIELEWSSGKYNNVVIVATNGLFDRSISDIRKDGERSEIYKYLKQKLNNLFVHINGASSTKEYYYPGKPTLNSIPNWSPGSIYYAGVGSRETPLEILDQMLLIASELEQMGYVLRSGGADGADLAFEHGIKNKKNSKIYYPDDIIKDHFGNAQACINLVKEVHPAADALNSFPLALHARNSYQIFGEKLDSPAAFVLCWTRDGVTSYESTTVETGGTGLAIRLASRKGIPVINMANPDWRMQLESVLISNKNQPTADVWYGTNGEGPNADLSNIAERKFILSDSTVERLSDIFKTDMAGFSVGEIMREFMEGNKFHGVEHAFQLAKFAAMYVHVLNQKATDRKLLFKKNKDVEEKGLTSEQKSIILNNIRNALRLIANARNNKHAKYLGGNIRIGDVYGIIDSFFKGVWNNQNGDPDPSTNSYKTMGLLQIDSFLQDETAAKRLMKTGNVRFTHVKGGKWATAFPSVLTKTRNYINNNFKEGSVPNVRTQLVIANSSSFEDMSAAAKSVGGIITTRQREEKYHFGNPFSHDKSLGIVTGNGTIKDAVIAFDKWLAGTDYKDVEPERRQWILDMINSGELDDVPLVYYTSNATDSEGTHVYDYNTFPNHAHILLKYINMHIANPMDFVERFASPLEAKATLESEKTILSNDELKYWNEQGITYPRILVATEHTDPAFFSKLIVDIIEGRQTAAGYKDTANKFTGKDFNALYIITKHDGLPLKKILETKIPKIIHFSITGLGGTVWEPNVMKYNDMLDRIQQFIKQGLDPKSITIRIDPIVPGVTPLSAIDEIMRRASEMGIKRIKFSVCDMYREKNIIRRDGSKRVRPAAWIPALERTEREYGKEARDKLWNTLVSIYGTIPGKPDLLNFNANPQRIYGICDKMAQFAEKYGLSLSTCAEDINHPKVSKDGCLSVSQVNELLGTSIEDRGTKNNNFREKCSCFGGKVDALDYDENCCSVCGYCYAGHANDASSAGRFYYNDDGTLKDFRFTLTSEQENKLLFDKNALREMGKKVLQYCNKNR